MAANASSRGNAPRLTIETTSPAETTAPATPKVAPQPSPEVRAQPASKPKLVVAPTAPDQTAEAATPDSAPQPHSEPSSNATATTAGRATASASFVMEDIDEEVPPRAAQAASDAPPAAEPSGTSGASGQKNFSDAQKAASGWVHRTFPGHEHAFAGAVVALLLALLVFAIGIGRVLFICVLVLIGITVGQILDGDPKIVRYVQDLIRSARGSEQ